MKILVVGAGSIGKRHADNLHALGCTEILMPHSRFVSEGWYSKQDQLKEYDGAVIATATHQRLEIIRCLAAADLPLYIEKPLCSSLSEFEAIEEATEHVATRSMVGFMMRYHPAFQIFAGMDLSRVYSYNFEIGHDVRKWRENWVFSKSYAARNDSGGVLLDLCHELDMALCLFPGTTRYSAESLGHPRYPKVDFCTRIALSDGRTRLGTVSMDYLSPVSFRRLSFRGIDFNADFDFNTGKGELHWMNQSRRIEFPHERDDLFLSAMVDFLNLAADRSVSISKHFPRLDLAMSNCAMIAKAREERRFSGMIAGDFP